MEQKVMNKFQMFHKMFQRSKIVPRFLKIVEQKIALKNGVRAYLFQHSTIFVHILLSKNFFTFLNYFFVANIVKMMEHYKNLIKQGSILPLICYVPRFLKLWNKINLKTLNIGISRVPPFFTMLEHLEHFIKQSKVKR